MISYDNFTMISLECFYPWVGIRIANFEDFILDSWNWHSQSRLYIGFIH
jgi:hypothetical protein